MNRLLVASVTLAVSIFACRDSGGGGGDDTTVDAPVNTDDVTIQMIQSSAITAGTAVNVKGVIVTVIDMYGGKTGDIWVQEPGGGEFSGVHVFGAELADVGALVPGDIVDITGAEKDEFAYQGSNGSNGDTSGRSVTELKPISGGKMSVKKVGSGAVPAPQVVDALAIGQKATQAEKDAEWEKWEGVLITVPNVSVTNSPRCVGSACNDETNNNFKVTGGIVVESTLAPLPGFVPKMGTTPAVPTSIKSGDCLAGVTGVVDYFFDYLLLNTSTTGVMTGGTSCPAAEAAGQCGDNMDNDGNGYTDCMDNNCIATAAACSVATTIPAVQATTPMGAVTIPNVYVTAVAFNGKNFWVSSNLNAAPNEGIYVFRCSGMACTTTPALDAGVVVGAKVSITGTVTEFNNDMTGDTLTEFAPNSITVVSPPTTAPVPVVGQTVDSLLANATGEPYEGVLVTLTNVKVVTLGTSANSFNADLSQKAVALTPFKGDDDMYRFVTADMGVCYATITGIWSYSTFNNAYIFLPRTAAGGTGVDGTVAPNAAVCN